MENPKYGIAEAYLLMALLVASSISVLNVEYTDRAILAVNTAIQQHSGHKMLIHDARSTFGLGTFPRKARYSSSVLVFLTIFAMNAAV